MVTLNVKHILIKHDHRRILTGSSISSSRRIQLKRSSHQDVSQNYAAAPPGTRPLRTPIKQSAAGIPMSHAAAARSALARPSFKYLR